MDAKPMSVSEKPVADVHGCAEEPVTSAGVLDRVGRALATGLPRRKAIGILMKGLVAVALWQLGVRTAWAADQCLCQGQAYDPAISCCLPSGVEPKNPIRDLSVCPYRVPRPNFVTGVNGCGPMGGVWAATQSAFVPNGFG